ncbi:MAG: hypothetical protein HZA14_02970 [Nitrospirae bacterium]|nr:hypothetical protein [Nitrospirota bacterium]
MRKQILFVTYQNEDFDEGLSYAIDLARTMNKDLTILMTQKKSLFKKFEELMTAVTFAEAGEHDTAREILSGKIDDRLNTLMDKYQNTGVVTRVYAVTSDAISATKDFLKQKNSVDMVLLSPCITSNGNITSSALQKLVRTASRPIVTMSRQVYAV